MKKVLYWLPRILAILFILFISMFAFDVFNEPQWFPALLMHLIPSFILIGLTVLAWKRERLGGWIFIILGLLFMLISNFEGPLISVPVIIIGALFAGSTYLSKTEKS